MFHSKKSQVDFKKTIQKFLDAKKDSRSRAHALRILLDNFETHEAKVFFQLHYSEIYYICNDYFSIVEVNLRQKANKSVREDLDGVLHILEKILYLLPELIHDRWQFGSIGRTMQKLLHHGNAFKIRSDGIRLLILWLQALQENMDVICEVMFACVVPGFPNPLQSIDMTKTTIPVHVLEEVCHCVRGADTSNASGSMTLLPQDAKEVEQSSWCTQDELQVLVPLINQNQTEKIPGLEDLTKVYLDRVLDYMITQIAKIEWIDKNMRKKGFECLFNLFKKYYLHHVFTTWSPQTNLYASDPAKQVQEICEKETTSTNDLAKYADSVVKWFVAFTSKIKRVARMQYGESLETRSAQSTDSITSSSTDLQQAQNQANEPNRCAPIYEDLIIAGNVIREVIYSSRENVHIVHEVFRQSFLLPMDKSLIIKEVIAVYYNWLKETKRENRPIFMQDVIDDVSVTSSDDICAGMQANVRLIIYHASFVFLTQPNQNTLSNQVDICKRVISLYRDIVLGTPMLQKTWEQLLVVLLTIAGKVLKDKPVDQKRNSFAGKLAATLLQTLFVTWIRANLNVTVSIELWDRFLGVVSSLTHWSEIVTEWKSTMDTLTSVIARRVYGLDLNDLPLERLTEQKHKKRRHLQAGSKKEHHHNNTNDRTKVSTNAPVVVGTRSEEVTIASTTVTTSQISKDTEVTKTQDGTTSDNQTNDTEEAGTSVQVAKDEDGDNLQVMQAEGESEKGYESDVTDSDSELSFETAEKSVHGDTDMSLNSLQSTNDSWPPVHTSTMTDDTKDDNKQEQNVIVTAGEQNDEDTGSNDVVLKNEDEVDGKRKRKKNIFWKDSGDEISSDNEVPASFSNPIHDETMFESVAAEAEEEEEDNPTMETPSVALEIVEPSVHSLDMSSNEVSVVCGGTKEGWSPVAAVVLWTRMLGILGNINDIENAVIHAQVLKALAQIWHLLAKIRLNQGISEDNKSTPSVPQLLPPLHYFSSWLFQSTFLPQKYKAGRLTSYELLCCMTVRRQDQPLSNDYLRHFYKCLHNGLTGTDQDIINAILSKCENFFSMVLPSSSLLMVDFISAANTVIDSASIEYPRTEAVTILSSLVCYPNAFPKMKIYQIGSVGDQPVVRPCAELKEKLIEGVYKAARTDPDCHARCTALCGIAVFVVEELTYSQGQQKINSYISLLLTSIVFKNFSVSSVAIGIIRNLSEYHEQLARFDGQLPVGIISVLCEIIIDSLNDENEILGVKILNSLMYCLLDWVMVVPLETLLAKVPNKNQNGLEMVFEALKFVVSDKSLKQSRDFNISRMITREDSQIYLGQIHQDIPDTPSTPVDDLTDACSESVNDALNRARKAAKAVISHIVNHLNHFPLSAAGAARLTSIVNESNSNPYVNDDQELTSAVFTSPNVQILVLNDSSLLSFVELPLKDSVAKDQAILCGNTKTRIIVRDMCGKHCLDIATLFGPNGKNRQLYPGVLQSLLTEQEMNEVFGLQDNDKQRKISVETQKQSDKLDQILQDIGTASPECLFYPHLGLNEPAPPPQPLNVESEASLMKVIETQRRQEEEYCKNAMENQSLKGTPISPAEYQEPSNPFHLSHFLFNQLGLFGWEKRSKIDLLKKSDKLIRELKHLDNRKSRETHKIAVFYVATGQEDKTSIISNSSGSKEYEQFIAGLGWEIDLSSHTGFMGGLDKNQSTGNTAVYFANSTVEVMFHVATRMPVSSDESGFIKKVRHLGNDEIWIVWSEHTRDFRHGIVNAEFGDVVIAIYPLKNQLFRIQILKKGEIPYFGPLFDGAIVDHRVLPSLVRMTAVNASRAKRSLIPGMQTYYDERANCIHNIVKNHKQKTVFEDFAEQLFCPAPRQSHNYNASSMSYALFSKLRQATGENTTETIKGYNTLPSIRITQNIVDHDPLSSTMSLPEGLHKVSQVDNLGQKMEKKRMSLRRKLASASKEDASE